MDEREPREIDAEPGSYRVRGRKEPVFASGGHWRLLGLIAFFVIGGLVIAPAFAVVRNAVFQLLWGYPYPGP